MAAHEMNEVPSMLNAVIMHFSLDWITFYREVHIEHRSPCVYSHTMRASALARIPASPPVWSALVLSRFCPLPHTEPRLCFKAHSMCLCAGPWFESTLITAMVCSVLGKFFMLSLHLSYGAAVLFFLSFLLWFVCSSTNAFLGDLIHPFLSLSMHV